jgi:hypothetical protein
MKKLFNSDYVIYDREKDEVIRWALGKDIIIFGDKEEALEDCRGSEEVIPCTELPEYYQTELLKQINNDN